jgi:hypothetical protein
VAKETEEAEARMTKLTMPLRIPENCKVVSPQHGTVFGFVGAEAFRKATVSKTDVKDARRRTTTSSRPGNDTPRRHEGRKKP